MSVNRLSTEVYLEEVDRRYDTRDEQDYCWNKRHYQLWEGVAPFINNNSKHP